MEKIIKRLAQCYVAICVVYGVAISWAVFSVGIPVLVRWAIEQSNQVAAYPAVTGLYSTLPLFVFISGLATVVMITFSAVKYLGMLDEIIDEVMQTFTFTKA